MTTTDERLAALEERVQGVREDLADLTAEMGRTRTRLHNLEGITARFVANQEENRRQEEAQYRRLGGRVQVVGLLLTAAAVLSPLLVVLLTGK